MRHVMWSEQHEKCAFPPFFLLYVGVSIPYIYVVFDIVKHFSFKLFNIRLENIFGSFFFFFFFFFNIFGSLFFFFFFFFFSVSSYLVLYISKCMCQV